MLLADENNDGNDIGDGGDDQKFFVDGVKKITKTIPTPKILLKIW